MFQREDWELFRTLETLSQKAGVAPGLLPRLVAKELADNALDASGSCRVGRLQENGFWVEDDGPGIDPRTLGRLFSIRRPLVSSKLLRLPTRGAMGNGLRVVAGTVLATGGWLRVETRNRTTLLTPRGSGETTAEDEGPSPVAGVRVAVHLGPALRVDGSTLEWAREALELSRGGPGYRGLTSPWWFDSDAFHELTQASGERTVRDLVMLFAGCTGKKAGKLAAAYRDRLANTLDRGESESLLIAMRGQSQAISHARLGRVGRVGALPPGQAYIPATLTIKPARGRVPAQIPMIIEAWAGVAEDDGEEFRVSVNRTPITATVDAIHDKTKLWLTGCGLNGSLDVGRRPLRVWLNVDTPHMPITSDGKAPDLGRLARFLVQAVGKATKRAKRFAAAGSLDGGPSQKDVILRNLDDAVAKASGGGLYRFSLRQLFYAVRPFVLDTLGKEPDYTYFAKVITDYETGRQRDIAGMYRDARGTLYHPHTGETIPLGTLNVEGYARPEWTFNKILYCEKEGFFPILREARWPERHDCALVTSKGFASRAVRDVLDLLGETEQALQFFCIHDADAYGTMIYQALQEETGARPGRRVEIVNLGLDPSEALEMGLAVEAVDRKGERAAPVADYVGEEWREWLQANRVELNAMTTPQFLGWLDRKFEPYSGKLVPPPGVLAEHLEREVRGGLGRQIRARILRRARFPERVERAVERRAAAIETGAKSLVSGVHQDLANEPAHAWIVPVRCAARGIVKRTRERVSAVEVDGTGAESPGA